MHLFSVIVPVFLVIFNFSPIVFGVKSVCLDITSDLQPSGWKFNTESYKYVESSSDLPKSFGNLNFLDGRGIWYVEGSGTGKDVKITSDPNLYARSRTVKIFLRYYDKSPRRISLQPVKSQPSRAGSANNGAGSIVLLPQSTGNAWTEVTHEINPLESPIEISGVLSAGQFILFEMVFVAVDTSLPKNATVACMDFTVYANQPTSKPQQSSNTVSTAKPSSGVITPSPIRSSANPQCPETPQPMECRCNCNCNCNKSCD